jgi:undecaprenyl-diphosphatase
MVSADARAAAGREWFSEVRSEVSALDQSVFDAIQRTPTPVLDDLLVRLSNSANHSKVWLTTAAVVAAVGGSRGRRAAVESVAAIGMASAVSNIALKTLAPRSRPVTSDGEPIIPSRQVRRPDSPSFPSGHAASAFAFATNMGESVPTLWMPLHLAATLVAYSRVHTGVHYPSDVISGALVGALSGWTVRRIANRVVRSQQAS